MAQEHAATLATAGWFDQAVFGYYPYIALAVLAIGSIIRFDREPYTWRSGSSQLLRRKQLMLGSVLFHVGVLIIFGGHFVGLLTPIEVFDSIGVSHGAKQVLAIIELLDSLPKPLLIHCKSGADRAGLMSVLYAHFVLGQPIRQAKEQLSWKYLHAKIGKTGVLDYMFDRYLTDAEPQGISFIDWVKSDAYDPAEMKSKFRAKWWGSLLTEHILRRE